MSMTRRENHRGFSLTELLVAMVIGLLLLGGLVTLMANSKKNYAVQDSSARLQENARFAMEFLSYDLRMAGYFGCSNTDVRDVDNIVPDNNDAVPRLVDGTNSHGDSVIVTYAHPSEQVQLLSYQTASPNQWTVERIPDGWGEDGNDIDLVVSSCAGASVVNATINDTENAAGDSVITLWDGSGSMQAALGRVYDPADLSAGPIMVSRLVSREYCIDLGESGVLTLHRETSPGTTACSANSQELVEGVENLRLLYHEAGGFATGIDTPSAVTAAQLGLLVRSISNEELDSDTGRQFGSETIPDDENPDELLGEELTPAALRGQRKVFSNTLNVRNRSL